MTKAELKELEVSKEAEETYKRIELDIIAHIKTLKRPSSIAEWESTLEYTREDIVRCAEETAEIQSQIDNAKVEEDK